MEHLFHHIPDSFLVLIGNPDALLHQQLLHKGFFGDKADNLLIGLVIETDCRAVHGKRHITALEQAGSEPVNVILHIAVGGFHKAVLYRFHGSFHMAAGVHGDETLQFVQSVAIGFCATLQCKGKLICAAEHLADIRLTHRRVDIGELMINGLHQPPDGLIDPSRHFFRGKAGDIPVHIDTCLFQSLGQIQLCVVIPLPHLHALGFFDGLILCKLEGPRFSQKPLDFQVHLHFRQELVIVGKNDKDLLALPGHHAQGRVIHAAVIPRSQDTQTSIIALCRFIGSVIHRLIERETIASIERRITITLVLTDVLKNHFRNLGDDLRHFHILFFNFVVDLLFLVRQEYIQAAVLLNQHLAGQHFQRILDPTFQFNAVVIDILHHQAGDIVDIRLDFQHILNHKQSFQDIDGKHIAVFLLRVDITVVVCPDDDAPMAVVKEIFQCVIETVERHDHANLLRL